MPVPPDPIVDTWLSEGLPVASKAWSSRVIDETFGLSRMQGTCSLEVEFVRRAERSMFEAPDEITLDKLLERLLPVLAGTVLRGDGVLGDAGKLLAIEARLRIARAEERTGIHVVVRPIAAGAPE